jgi:creatinine amidohydrolase
MSDARYENLTPTDFRARLALAPIAYVPLGTLEWHGEHLPLGSDGLQSRAFFERIAAQVGGIVLPMMTLGPDRKQNDLIGMDYAETVDPPRKLDGSAYWVDGPLFDEILRATVAQLVRAGFRIIVAHGHGPSTAAWLKLIPEFEARHDIRCHHCWLRDPSADGLGMMVDHAATNETSLMMALHPHLVRMDLAPAYGTLVGVGGRDPRVHASAEFGERCIDIIGSLLLEQLREDLARL